VSQGTGVTGYGLKGIAKATDFTHFGGTCARTSDGEESPVFGADVAGDKKLLHESGMKMQWKYVHVGGKEKNRFPFL